MDKPTRNNLHNLLGRAFYYAREGRTVDALTCWREAGRLGFHPKPSQTRYLMRLMEPSMFPQWAIYKHPADHPNSFVAREWVAEQGQLRPTGRAAVGPTREEVLKAIPQGYERVDRQEGDDPVIVETWVPPGWGDVVELLKPDSTARLLALRPLLVDDGDPPLFICPRCAMPSWNPHDAAHGYCGRCHDWTGKPQR